MSSFVCSLKPLFWPRDSVVLVLVGLKVPSACSAIRLEAVATSCSFSLYRLNFTLYFVSWDSMLLSR